jgi:endoglycosylceramidase
VLVQSEFALTAPALPLGHVGRWITDAHGRVMIVHGTNMVYKVAPYFPGAVGFDSDDAAFLRSIGFNAVRVGVIWKALEPQPGVYDDHYLAQIAATVHTLASQGILSLLDFHQDLYNETFQGEGFPAWSVQDDGLPHEPKRGFPQNYFVMPALWRAYDHFWENSPGPGGVGLQDRYAAAWAHVARRFRNTPSVLGDELMNEPFPGSPWAGCAAPAGCPAFDWSLVSFIKRIDRAIRKVDRRTLMWYEPNVAFDFGPNTTLGPVGDPRAGFSFHDYCFEYEAFGSSNSCATTGDLVVSNALHHAQQSGDALLMTEWGDPDYALMKAMVKRDDRSMIPWLEWSYCPCTDPTGAASKTALVHDPSRPPRGSNLNMPGLAILVEPYPQLIAGMPLSWGFDAGTKTFALRYSTARVDGRRHFKPGELTVVAVPRSIYGHGYAALVSGGTIVSRRGSSVLLIAACRRASIVVVTVSPRGRSRGSCQRRGSPGDRATAVGAIEREQEDITIP